MKHKTQHETLPWFADPLAGLYTPSTRPRFTPINIKRTNLPAPRLLDRDDTMTVHITEHQANGKVNVVSTPPMSVGRRIKVDHILKCEVLDELGLDVGVGFILGQAKK